MSDSMFDRAVKIKGYGSYPNGKSNASVEAVKTLKDGFTVKPTVIESLEDYVRFVNGLETTFANPVFYRGQVNANYLLIPYSLRGKPEHENLLIDEFSRRFSNEVDECRNALSKLVLMQHYGLKTRCMDITESPLAALYFACVPYKKFKRVKTDETATWGEIVLFRELPRDGEEKRPERLKTVESSNASIIANTAFMGTDFSLWHLGSFWKKDANQTYDEKYIDLRSVVRASYIVRVPQNNPRITNQRGAFIIGNANTAHLGAEGDKKKELTEYILKSDYYVTYADLLKEGPFKAYLNETETWYFKFSKVRPYDDGNEFPIFRDDPFDLRRLFCKDKKGCQRVVLIPPDAKKKITEELGRFGITEDFIYPDMDSVANEINTQING